MFTALLPALLLVSGPFDGSAAEAPLTFDRAELQTEAGRTALYERVVDVATDVCEAENQNGMMPTLSIRICVADTVERTITAIGEPRLIQFHASLSVSPDSAANVVHVAMRD